MKNLGIAGTAGCLLALTFVAPAVCATTVMVKNNGHEPMQIGFDRGATRTIAPRATESFTLDAGQHTAQCRFEGQYDGCNIEEQFTLADSQRISLDLMPIYTLQHAVTLVQQGNLSVEMRRDTVWATKAQDVAGTGTECASYEAGTLASVSTRVRSGSAVAEVALATQRLCGETRPVVAATIGGEKVYVQPSFLIFRDASGHPILVRQ